MIYKNPAPKERDFLFKVFIDSTFSLAFDRKSETLA